MLEGGFPEFQKQKSTDVLTSLLDDVVIRDIRCVHRLHLWLLGFNRFAAAVGRASGASTGCTCGYWDSTASRLRWGGLPVRP
jgi:hypothetical protein